MYTNNLDEKVEVKKSKKKKIWIFLLLVLISVFGVAFYLYNKGQSAASTDGYVDMQSVFTIPEYDNIPENFRNGIYHLFEQNEFIYNGSEFFTKIPSRAKKVIAYGNFSNKKTYNGPDALTEENYINDDIAFILEKNDFKSSVLYIMAENGGLLYYKDFDGELPTISSFKKGAKIYINDRVLEKAPSDGILIFTKYSKNVLLYNPKENVFETYYQYTKEDLEYNEEDYYEEGVEEGNEQLDKTSEKREVITDSTKVY